MSVIVSGIITSLDEPRENAIKYALKKLGLNKGDISCARLYKSSVDARHKVCFVSSVMLELKGAEKERQLAELGSVRPLADGALDVKPTKDRGSDIYIAGFGPAGMFCALTLCEYGFKPTVIERGAAMDERVSAVNAYWSGKGLDPRSNVQFGEGGAGTFSDGKLTTRINDPLCARVLDKLCEFGAPKEILTEAKPHIGTDKLRGVVKNIRRRIIELGGNVLFLSQLEDIGISGGRVCSVKVNGAEHKCGSLVLAIGHSAHDTFGMLLKNGISITPKPFSVGARIEHLQEDINTTLYGKYAGHPALPPAEYALSHRENDRGVYTFCMCPGGYVVASASEDGSIVTNGMSNFDRAGKNANSALLVSVSPEDFGDNGSPLSGVDFIRRLEQRAYELGGNGGKAPSMTARSFLGERGTCKAEPTYPLGIEEADLRRLFPEYVTEYLAEGLRRFNRKIHGFADGRLTAIESRTSSPVRIPRGDSGEALGIAGLFPCGEGAGYAGGIMSAAVDGIRTAIKIMEV